MSDDLDKGLNQDQLNAVEHTEGPVLVIAGAGTGKTTVITRRIAKLIEKGVEPACILALTFTEKAAGEMEERLDRLVPYGYSNVTISTFHSFGVGLLRDNALELGLAPDFKTLSEEEGIIFLKENLFRFPLGYYRPLGDPAKYLSHLATFISRLKDEDITADDYGVYVEKIKKDGRGEDDPDILDKHTELALSYAVYQELMGSSNYIDYGDQVTLPLRLLRTRPGILKRYREKYRYILTDEFQDTNYAQFELLKLLAGERKNLMVVADDDQSIYKFRGAAISNVLKFLEVFSESRTITLTKNYRSVQPILDSAYRLITHNNPDRLEVKSGVSKRLVSDMDIKDGDGVRHINFDTIKAEVSFVADTIEKGVKDGADCKDFAILVRTRSDAKPFLAELELRGIAHRFSSNSGLYSRDEIDLLVSYLRIITDPSDNLSLYRLATSGLYAIDAKDILPCNHIAQRQHRLLYNVMRDVAGAGASPVEISKEGIDKIKSIVSDIGRFSEIAVKEPATRTLYKILTGTGYMSRLTAEPTTEAVEKIRNIARFFDMVLHIETTLSIKDTVTFAGHLRLLIEAGGDPGVACPDTDDDSVNVLTIHKAKGLEFPYVFMVSLADDRFPTRDRRDRIEVPEAIVKDIAINGDFHLQEERRLFYVGMTRAMRQLYLTSNRGYGGKRAKKTSRFVLEALDMPRAKTVKSPPAELIEKYGGPSISSSAAARRRVDAQLHLTCYHIDDYLTCPLKYRYARIQKVPLLPHHTIIYGKAMHEAIAFYFRRKITGAVPPAEEVIDVFKGNWRGEGFLSKEHEEKRIAEGISVLERFYERDGRNGLNPSAVERDFSIEIGADILRGRWDLIEERGNEPYIIDFKTSRVDDQNKADERAKDSLQLVLYALAYKDYFKRPPSAGELHFVESGLVGTVIYTDKMLDSALGKINEVSEGIKSNEFGARPGYMSCKLCAYSNICPEKRNL
ncbi:MAG: ATP-dependent helicase [Deltaproteobacteria bacterium]|nr:ATP-dependent helicase [Deltaproteobacteria bacterium]